MGPIPLWLNMDNEVSITPIHVHKELRCPPWVYKVYNHNNLESMKRQLLFIYCLPWAHIQRYNSLFPYYMCIFSVKGFKDSGDNWKNLNWKKKKKKKKKQKKKKKKKNPKKKKKKSKNYGEFPYLTLLIPKHRSGYWANWCVVNTYCIIFVWLCITWLTVAQ